MSGPDLSAFRMTTIQKADVHEIPPRTHRDHVGRYRAELVLECGHTVTIDYRYATSDTGVSRARARNQAVALTAETFFKCPACPAL